MALYRSTVGTAATELLFLPAMLLRWGAALPERTNAETRIHFQENA